MLAITQASEFSNMPLLYPLGDQVGRLVRVHPALIFKHF
jgi:hypothetical protein